MQHDDDGRDEQRHRGRFTQQLGALLKVPAAIGLSRHARRAHAQEPKVPVHQVKHHCAHRHGTNKHLVAQMPSDSGIHQSQQRHRDVGHNRRQRNLQYLPIHAIFHAHKGTGFCTQDKKDNLNAASPQFPNIPQLKQHTIETIKGKQ